MEELGIKIASLGRNFNPQYLNLRTRSRSKRLAANSEISPQDIQKNFSQFLELQSDLLVVNQRLMTYRQKMYEIVTAT